MENIIFHLKSVPFQSIFGVASVCDLIMHEKLNIEFYRSF